jgi:hypothetical protein
MKYTFSCLILCIGLFCPRVHAQHISPATTSPTFVYLTLGGGLPIRGGASLDVLFGKKYSVSLFAEAHSTVNSPNTPNNYDCGFCLFEDHHKVRNEINTYGLTVGKVFSASNQSKIRMNLKTGLGYSIVRQPVNFQAQKPDLFESNYKFDWKENKTVSLIVRPMIEIPFTRFWGLGLGMMLNVNAYRSFVGFDANMHIGSLRAPVQK